jgi:HlyD family secretion protein
MTQNRFVLRSSTRRQRSSGGLRTAISPAAISPTTAAGPRCLAALAPAALLLAALLAPGCGGNRDRAEIVASGHIEMTQVRISTKVGGTLLSFPLQEGDRVSLGQQLAQIDTTDLVLTRAAARADLGQATAELNLRLAGSRQDEIAETEALLARAQAENDAAGTDFERMDGLLREGSGTIKARDDARNRRDQAAANLEAVKQQLHRRRTGSRPEEIAAARARQSAAQARLDQVEQQLHDACLRSPIAGLVSDRLAEPGELLPPGSPLCVLDDLASPWLAVYVGEQDLGRIHPGQEAAVLTDAGEKRTGKISFISSDAEFTPKNVQTREERVKLVYKVKIALENQDGLFKRGMPAEARIHGAAR